MDVSELLAALEENPQDGTAFEKALTAWIDAGDNEILEQSLAAMSRALVGGPAAETVLKTLDGAYRRRKDSDAGRIVAWHAGLIAWKAIGDPVRAEFFFRGVTPEGHFEADWTEFYRGFYASRGNWLRLEQFVAEAGERRGWDAVQVKRVLAQTAHEYNNPSKELSYWQAVAQAQPDDEEAEAQLERLYTQLERWPSLADLLKERLKRFDEGDRDVKVAILRGMLRIYADKMKAEPKVLATYQQILEVDPANLEAIDALLERYEAAGRWPDYVKVLARKVDAVEDPDEQIRLMEIQANLMETRFANVLEALKAYERILELAPGRRDIVDKLKDLYEKRRDYESLIRLRRTEAEQMADPEARVRVFAELAETAAERLRKAPVAIELWEKVLEIDPVHVGALKALDGLYDREKDFDRQCGVVSRLVDLSTQEGEQVALLEKLAGIQGTKMGDAASALETWRRILDVRPTHERAKRELRTRYLAEHRWDDLEWFLRKFGTIEELGRTLEAQVGSIEDKGEKLGLLFKVAAIWRDEADQPQKAVRHLEAALALDAESLHAAVELIGLYRSLGDWRKLPPVYDVAIQKTIDAAERKRLMLEAAEVHEVNLGNAERAFFLYLDAFKENLLDDDLRMQAERLAGPSRNWDIYVAVLEQAAPLLPDDERKVATWLRVGEIRSIELDEGEEAQAAFQKALALDPGNRAAVFALDALYRRMERWGELVDVLRRRLDLERRTEERKPLRFDIAQILYAHLGRTDEAIAVYEDILAEETVEIRAYTALGELLLAERRFEELRRLLSREVEAMYGSPEGTPDVLADLHCRIATLTCAIDGATEAAVQSCAMALEQDPLHGETIALLEDLLGEAALRLDIVNLLRGPFEATGRWTDLADLLEIELSVRGDSAGTAGILWRLEGLYADQAADAQKRFRTLSRILKVTPEDARSWDAIERVAGEVEGWRDLAGWYETAAKAIQDAEARVQVNLRLARIEWQELNNTDHARRAYHEVLANDDANVDALDALETIYEQVGDHPELLKVYRRRFDVSPYAGEKIAYAFKMASELSDHLEDVEGAIGAVRMVLDLDPEYEMAYRQLDALYTRAERWYDLAGVLNQRVALAGEASERSYLRMRLAEVLETRLEDVAGAVEVYRLILEDDPRNEDALGQLERLFGSADVRVAVAGILLPAYRLRENDARLVEVYDVLAEAAPELDARLGHWATIAGLHEQRLGNLDQAFAYRARAFRDAPERASLVDEVLRVGEARGALDEAVLVLVEKVFEIEDEDRRKETHRTIARTCRDKGIDRELAKRHFAEILRIDAEDMDALDALIRLHDEDGETEALVGLLGRKADLVAEPLARGDLLAWAGDLYATKLGKVDEAIGCFTGVLDLDPVNLRAIEALEGLYEKSARWVDLVDVMGRKADVVGTPGERVAALKKKGLIQHERLGATQDAVETFLEVLAVDASDVDAMRTLDRFYGAMEDWASQYDMLGRMQPLVAGEDRLTVRYRMGRLLEKELGDSRKAIETYEELLIEWPDNADAVDALEGMVRADEAAEEAFRVLGPTLSERGEWARLYVVYDVLTGREEDVARKVSNLLTMGEIAEHRMGEPLRGFECYGRAFTADPMNREVLGRIDALAETHDMWHDVPDLLLGAARNIEGTPESVALRLRAGAVQRDRLADRDAAVAAFEGVLADYPDNGEALVALDRLYGDMGRHADQVRILRAHFDATTEVADKIALLLRQAEICETRLDRSKEALEALAEVLYLQPAHPRAVAELRRMFDEGKHRERILEMIEPIYLDTAAFTDLATVYESSLGAIEDPDRRKETLLKLADVWMTKLGDGAAAMGWFGKALAIDPADESLLIQVEMLAQETSGWQALLDILLAAASATGDDGRRVQLWHKAVDCAKDRLGDFQRAEAVCRWILDVDAGDATALAVLDGMFENQERYADLLGVLEREWEVADYDDEKVRFLMRAGALQRDRLDDLDGAVDAFRKVVAIDEMHRGALEALAQLHETRGEAEPLFRTLGTLADMAETGAARGALQRRMARIAEDRLDRKEAALALWDEVAAGDPTDVESLRELQRLHREREEWEAFVDACEREIALVEHGGERTLDLLREVARTAETKLGDATSAQHAWRRLLAIARGDREALESLRRLYHETGDLEALSDVLSQLFDSPLLSGDEKRQVSLDHARLLTDELGRPEGAIEQWNRVLEGDANHAEALAALDRLYEDTGRHADCVAIVRRRADLVSGDARATLLVRAAEIQNGPLGDPAGSAETLEIVAALQPGNRDVSENLESLYNRLEDWPRLAAVLLRRDDHLADDVDARIANLSELARVHETRMGARDAAFFIWAKAAQIQPADDLVAAELWRLAQDLGWWTEYVDHLAEVSARMPEEMRQEHLLRFGEVLWRRAERPQQAIGWYEKVRAVWPENEVALGALNELYRGVGRWEDLIGVLSAQIEVTPDYLEKVRLATMAGVVLEAEVGDNDRALKAYRQVLEFDEGNLDALDAVIRIHEARNEWEDLLGALDRKAPLVPQDEVAIRMRMGAILEGRVGDNARAIQAYEAVLSLEPTHAEALDRLKDLYGANEDWRGLADVYERQLGLSNEVPDRILFCHHLAMLYEQALGDKRKSLDYWMQILDLDREDDEAFETGVRLLTEMEDWNELVNLLESRIAATQSTAVKVATLKRLSDVHDQRLGDVNSAIATYQRIVEVDPGNVEAYGELVRMFGQIESWEDVVDTLMKWKEHVDGEAEFVRLLHQAADVVREKLENPDRAIKLLNDLLRVEPTNEAAYDKLREIHGGMEDWEKVAAVYLAQEAHARTDEARARLRAAAGDVYQTRLKDRNQAIQHYERSMELNPKQGDVALGLARAYVATERWEKAQPLLEALLDSPEAQASPALAGEIHFQLGLCGERLLDFERAFREFHVAAKLSGDHANTLLGLGRMYQRKQLWQLSKDHYVKAMHVAGETLDDEDVADASFALGEVCIELGEFDDAAKYLDRALELQPNMARATELQVTLAEKRGDWASVIRYKQARVAGKGDVFERFAVLLEVGDIYRAKLNNVYGAAAAYKEALELNPGAKVPLLRLFDLYMKGGQTEDALYVLEQLAKVEEAPAKRAGHFMTMAAIYQQKLSDETRAIEYLNAALDEDPDELQAFRAIDEILTRARNWTAQAEAYRRMLERLRGRGNPELEYRLLANLGEIFRSRLKQNEDAIAVFEQAAVLKPAERRTHEILAQLYEVTGDQHDKAVAQHQAIVSGDPLGAASAESYRAMWRLYRQMGDLDRAFIVSSVMVGLGLADGEERAFFENNLEPSLPWFKGTIEPLRWESHLLAKGENTLLGRILQVLFQGLGAELGAKELKDVGLKKKSEIDLDQKLLFVNVYKAVTKALGPLPHKVYRDENPTGLKLEFLTPPALVVGSDMLTGHDEREVAFFIGRQLAYLNPMHFLAAVKNMTELKVFLAAVLKFCRPDTQLGAGADVVIHLVRLIERRMPQQQKNQMATLVEELASRYPAMDFHKMFEEFFQSIELSSLRAGALVSGSVPTVLGILQAEDVSFSGMPQRARLEEVVRFAVSEDHFVLRRALGLAVEAP